MFKPFKSLKAFRIRNGTEPDVLAQKLSKISKPLLKQFREIASDLGAEVAYGEDESG